MAHVPVAGARGILGRGHGSDVVVLRAQVSSRHLQIVHRGDSFEITDLKSTNGTWVNGARITGPTRVQAEDRLRVAQLSIELLLAPLPEAESFFNLLQAESPIDHTTSEVLLDDLGGSGGGDGGR
jgi:pSer/pThr/pTyr-binding forkhead associated (FHA) protein